MEPHEPQHPDTSGAPVLTGERRVRDGRTGAVATVDAWIAERMSAEGRGRGECLDELINAVARGDLIAEDETP
jgi:hypothetical protein